MLKISVILTCYKQEKYIEETILSVVNQTYKNRELLIWDDSPDDNCRTIIKKYVEKYPDKIHAWHHNPNKWIVKNMLFLLNQRNKKSEYIAFLEWDDCLFPEYFCKKLEIFSRYSNVKLVYNELSAVDSDWNVIDKRHLKNFTRWFCRQWKLGYEELINEIFYISWSTLMVKSDMVGKYSICPSFLSYRTIISDLVFFNQIAHNEDIYWIVDPLIFYRFHNESTSWSLKGAIQLNFDLIEYMRYLFDMKYISWCFCNKVINKRYLMISILALRKCLSMGMRLTISNFIKECINKIRRDLKKLF